MPALPWHECDRRGSRLNTHHRLHVGFFVATVLRSVRGIDLVIKVWVGAGVPEAHVFLDAASPNSPFVADLGATEPGGGGAIRGSNVEIITDANDPDRRGFSQRAVAPERSDFQLFRCPILLSSSLVHSVIDALHLC